MFRNASNDDLGRANESRDHETRAQEDIWLYILMEPKEEREKERKEQCRMSVQYSIIAPLAVVREECGSSKQVVSHNFPNGCRRCKFEAVHLRLIQGKEKR